ncbi:hypothetical protein ETB97_011522 [Aspergillus alliaceus]|uniref:Uncharacterized protein n=1 Tax=Petromyces alliaceus TaxID=209559 RepID=A0A8H6A8L0_PETAA|nr:hypothetical protein ETB97_011522 [Aspergillus burnettii]
MLREALSEEIKNSDEKWGTEELIHDDDSEEEDFSSYRDEPPTRACFTNNTTIMDRLYHPSFKIQNPAMQTGIFKALNLS